MATMTNEQIEQKKQLLAEKEKEMKAIYDELVEAGAIELSEDDLDKAAGGTTPHILPQHHPDQPSSRPLKEDTNVKPNFKPFPEVKF